jgi:hypothetical protein
MNTLPIFVLVETHSKPDGKDIRRNADVTCDLAEAEAWAEQKPKATDEGFIEYSFDNFEKPTELVLASAEITLFLREMRELRENVAPIQQLIADITLMRVTDEEV